MKATLPSPSRRASEAIRAAGSRAEHRCQAFEAAPVQIRRAYFTHAGQQPATHPGARDDASVSKFLPPSPADSNSRAALAAGYALARLGAALAFFRSRLPADPVAHRTARLRL